MSKIIPLTRLVCSDRFLDGSMLYRKRSFVILSNRQEKGFVIIEGILKTDPDRKIKFSIDKKSGDIFDISCGFECSGICEHIIGTALFYNEIAVEGLNPIEQLSKLTLDKTTIPEKKVCRIIFDRSSMSLDVEPSDMQMEIVLKMIGKKNISALIAIFPEQFQISGMKLQNTDVALNLMYSTEKGSLSFNLPPETFHFEETGVVLNTENGSVWKFNEKTSNVLSTLLNISMEYCDQDELAGVISVLSENVSPLIKLQGDINLKKIILDENTEVLFKALFDRGKIHAKVFFKTEEGPVEFKPKRKNIEQSYPANGKIFIIDPGLIKNIKTALKMTGFKYMRDKYSASVDKYHEISAEKSPLRQIGEVVFENEIKKVSFNKKNDIDSEIKFDLNVREKWFSFKIKLPESENYIFPEELVKAVQQIEKGVNDPVVFDSSGDPVILEKSALFLKRISEILPAGETGSWKKLHFGHLLKMLNSDSRKTINSFYGSKDSQEGYEKIFSTIKKGSVPEIDVPEEIRSKLRNYQIEGLKWLTLLRDLHLGGVLADEMGLGKTIQSLAMIKMETGDKPSMVIAPKTLIWSWDREIEKFFPEMKRVVIDSMKIEERIKKWKNCSNELIITSYSIAVNDLKYIRDKEFKTVIADEAQHIKNSQTKRFMSLMSINSQHKFALTGTPIENHIRDIWSIFQFVMPGFLGKRKDVDRIEKRGSMDDLLKLSSSTAPFILRRTKREMLSELPELTIKEYPVEMTLKQKEVYLSVLLRGRAEYLENKSEMSSIQILSILSKLRLAANHPSLVKETASSGDDSGKILTILELVDEIIYSNGKVLIFSQYVKMLKLIETALKKQGRDYFYMDGRTKERMDLVERFNNGERSLFLLSLKVGGVGLNLTGADNVIIVDPWWNPAAEEQAWSRAHRIGQEKRVEVHKLFSKGTIEEKIIDMQTKKKDLTDHFMSRTIKKPSEDFIKMVADMELAIDG